MASASSPGLGHTFLSALTRNMNINMVSSGSTHRGYQHGLWRQPWTTDINMASSRGTDHGHPYGLLGNTDHGHLLGLWHPSKARLVVLGPKTLAWPPLRHGSGTLAWFLVAA